MHAYLRHFDCKVTLFALLACYVLPSLLVGTLMSAALLQPQDQSSLWGQRTAMALSVLYFVLPPLAAGYFTVRHSRSLPQLHVVLVTAVGFAGIVVTSNAPLFVYVAYAVMTVLLSALGAFVWVRSRSHNET